MLKVWNVTLIISTFVLTILGTFLTRSGILSSVHAFAEGPIGYWFLGFIAIVLLASLGLLAGRSGDLDSDGRLDSPASRETVFLLNNLVFAAFTFTVLLGTLFPLVAEAARGVRVTVGEPFFNRMTLPLSVMLLFLVGVGPVLPWGRAGARHFRRLAVPAAVGAASLLVALAWGARSPLALAGFAFAGFALAANLGEFVSGAGARVRAHAENPVAALGRLVRANPRRFGGYLAHIGMLLIAVGVLGSSTFLIEREATLARGESMEVGDYSVRYDDIWAREEPRRFVVAAELGVFKEGERIATLDPRLNYYQMSDQPISTPAVRSRLHEDLYLNLMAFERDGSTVTIRAFVEPLVIWIWIGGLLMGVGAAVAFRYRGRQVERASVGRTTPAREEVAA